jgi:hypothetical protein
LTWRGVVVRGSGFSGASQKQVMEELKTANVSIRNGEAEEEFTIHEKDHGDDIVYDIYKGEQYLMTISRDGSILFLNFEADERSREIFKLSYLHRFIDEIEQIV